MQGEETKGREQKVGQVFVSDGAGVPEAVAAFGDSLENEFDGAESHLPANEEAEEATDLVGFRGQGETLKVKNDVELGEETLDKTLVGLLVLGGRGDGDVDFFQGETAEKLEDDVVDVAAKG